jgi:hypothetical protein
VVGDGVAHSAIAGALVAGYGNGMEIIGPWLGFVTVKERAPGWLTNPTGK